MNKATGGELGAGGGFATGGGVFKSFETTITSAQLLALRATPITLAVAPGVGKVYEFVSVLMIARNGTAYVVGTNDMAIRFKDGSSDIISQTIDTAGLLDQTADLMAQAGPIATDNKTPKADCDNQPLVLHNTGASEFTTGTGTLRVKITVRVWTSSW